MEAQGGGAHHALRYFLAVARELHFARVAESLQISPPSLSQQISRLEQQVGRQLFVRTSRTVELTDAGRQLVPLAARAVDAHAAVGESIEQLDRADQPLLRLGFVVGMGGSLTSRIIATATTRIEGLRIAIEGLAPSRFVMCTRTDATSPALTAFVRIVRELAGAAASLVE